MPLDASGHQWWLTLPEMLPTPSAATAPSAPTALMGDGVWAADAHQASPSQPLLLSLTMLLSVSEIRVFSLECVFWSILEGSKVSSVLIL